MVWENITGHGVGTSFRKAHNASSKENMTAYAGKLTYCRTGLNCDNLSIASAR